MSNTTDRMMVNGSTFYIMDAEARAELTARQKNTIKPLYVMQMVSNLPQFSISAVRASREGVYYTYTITTLQHDAFNGVSMVDTGDAYENYIFNYEEGCDNVGTSSIYKFDDTIVSEEITGYAAWVIDRSDYTIKIISAMDLDENHRVLAMFFRNGDDLTKSLTGFGTNGKLFGQRYAKDFNRFYLQNGNGAPIGALTLSYDESTKIYTVSRNNSTFFVYGFSDWDMNLIGIGADGISNLTYPMPSTFSSASGITNFAAIVAERFNNTTSTWKIIDQATLQANKEKYIVLGFVYRKTNKCVFFEGMAKSLFTNYIETDPGVQVQDFQGDLYKAFKRVGVIGDSLSVGYMYNKTEETAEFRMLDYSWPKQVMKTAGVPWLNLGTAGQGTLTWYSNSTYGKVQAEAAGNKCQAYIIGLGQNDQHQGVSGYAPLGTPEDITDDYTALATTYYGGYSRIIALLKHINPDCVIFCLTNPMSGGNRAAYNEAVKYIADTHYASDGKVITVDLAEDFGYLFNNGFLQNDYDAITGGHYSAEGYARIATIMQEAISRAMEKSVTALWDIAFIPYDTTDPTANTMTE